MPAATLSNYRSAASIGPFRTVYGTITNMNNGDTLTFRAFKTIKNLNFTPTTNSSFGFTISGNVATMVSGGALSGIIEATGY